MFTVLAALFVVFTAVMVASALVLGYLDWVNPNAPAIKVIAPVVPAKPPRA